MWEEKGRKEEGGKGHKSRDQRRLRVSCGIKGENEVKAKKHEGKEGGREAKEFMKGRKREGE